MTTDQALAAARAREDSGGGARGDASDTDLLHRLAGGDESALAALYDRYAKRIYNHCFRALASCHDAEDAVAQTFLTLWRRRTRIPAHDGSAAPWLYGVATNAARNIARGRQRQLRLVGRLGEAQGGDGQADHAQAVDRRVDAERQMAEVLAAVRRLPRREQEVLALVAWSGLSYQDTAAALGIPVGTVRSRLSRARARLGHDIEAEEAR